MTVVVVVTDMRPSSQLLTVVAPTDCRVRGSITSDMVIISDSSVMSQLRNGFGLMRGIVMQQQMPNCKSAPTSLRGGGSDHHSVIGMR